MQAVPFNSLGQIIADGGIQSLAIGIASGWDEATASSWLSSHYTGIPNEVIAALIGYAFGAISAGEALTDAFAEAIPEGLGEPGDELTIAGPTLSGVISVEDLRNIANLSEADKAALSQQFGIDILPIVPDLFGDEPLGRRAALGLEVTMGDKSTRIRIDVDLAGVETWKDLLDLIEERIQIIDDTDPARFDGLSDTEKFDTVTKIIYGLRRW